MKRWRRLGWQYVVVGENEVLVVVVPQSTPQETVAEMGAMMQARLGGRFLLIASDMPVIVVKKKAIGLAS